MANFNKVILMGNLTRDPELRYTPSGTAVADFGLAINRRRRNASGERRDETCFVDVTAWGRQAEVVNEYLSKGSPIFLEGRLQLDEWTSSDGQRRSKLKVVLEGFQFISPRGSSRDEGSRPRQPQGERRPSSSSDEDHGGDDEPPFDDVPF
jgi:single-strand DNA-binding protein